MESTDSMASFFVAQLAEISYNFSNSVRCFHLSKRAEKVACFAPVAKRATMKPPCITSSPAITTPN